MAYIHVYKNNPTAAGTDGTLVSEGDGTQAITVTLNATNNEESAPIKQALRCDTGYQTSGDITIVIAGHRQEQIFAEVYLPAQPTN